MSLPPGFFDDETEQEIKQQERSHKASVSSELESFMNEINSIPLFESDNDPNGNDNDPNDEVGEEGDDDAVHLAYMTRIASLRMKSLKRNAPIQDDFLDPSSDQKAVDEILAVNLNDDAKIISTSKIEDILRQQRLFKKKKK